MSLLHAICPSPHPPLHTSPGRYRALYGGRHGRPRGMRAHGDGEGPPRRRAAPPAGRAGRAHHLGWLQGGCTPPPRASPPSYGEGRCGVLPPPPRRHLSLRHHGRPPGSGGREAPPRPPHLHRGHRLLPGRLQRKLLQVLPALPPGCLGGGGAGAAAAGRGHHHAGRGGEQGQMGLSRGAGRCHHGRDRGRGVRRADHPP
mmetsp:Transcript_12479/g.39501  ORF Transcript_12479/g.39501 Transcript_12479/m.39501 type:complete len:200 (+) Transcript_12479:933-1532(+)